MCRETAERENRGAHAVGKQSGLGHSGPAAMGRSWVAVPTQDPPSFGVLSYFGRHPVTLFPLIYLPMFQAEYEPFQGKVVSRP